MACTSKATNFKEVRKEVGNGVIRIYADTIGWAKKLPCRIEYKGKTYQGEVKYRGGMSSKYPKHSMTLELEQDISIAGLLKNDDWILNANYIDKTFQRHKLSYDIFRSMHPDNKAPRCAYVPMYLNDNFIGLYVIMEKVNGSWLGLDKNTPNGARLFKDPFVFVEERLPNVQEPNNYYQQKFPEVEKKDCNNELDAFKTFLFHSSDSAFVVDCGKWLNLRNVMDWHLLLLLTNNDDGLFKNYYLYRPEGSSSYEFIPWDYDHSFGRDGNYDLNLIDREVGWRKVVLLRRLMELPQSDYAEALKTRYLSLRSNVFSEKRLMELIQANDVEVRPQIKANTEKWPLDAKWYSDANDYDAELDILKQYIPLRLEQLDTFFTTLKYGEEEKN